jgi:hypothetical protein
METCGRRFRREKSREIVYDDQRFANGCTGGGRESSSSLETIVDSIAGDIACALDGGVGYP